MPARLTSKERAEKLLRMAHAFEQLPEPNRAARRAARATTRKPGRARDRRRRD